MADTPATRKATRARVGPWFARQIRNPAAPGMTYATMLALVRRGQITAYSVIRGPTTGQLWRFAAHTRGLSREFGLCFACGAEIDRASAVCGQCGRSQQPPADPDVLLEPLPTATSAPASSPPPLVQREIPAPQPRPPATAPAAPLASADARAKQKTPPVPQPRLTQPSVPQQPVAPSPTEPGPAPRGEEILNAHDLAAAFQLQVDPKVAHRSRRRRRAWIPRERGRLGRLVLALIVLILSAGTIVLLVNPKWRRMALNWTSSTSSQLWTRWASAGESGAPSPATAASQPTQRAAAPARTVVTPPARVPQAALSTPAATSPTAIVSPPTTAPVAQASVKVISPAPQSALPAAAPATRPSEPVARPSEPATRPSEPVVRPAETVRQPAQARPQPSTRPADVAQSYDQARTLWRAALDAEARRDYTAAVTTYEQIRQLPREVWPAGLEINLDLARRRVR